MSHKAAAPLLSRVSISKASVNFGRLARRAHRNNEYFIVEQDGIPLAGIIGADELEDYLELRDPEVTRKIQKSNEDIRAGHVRSADELLDDLRRIEAAKSRAAKRRKQ